MFPFPCVSTSTLYRNALACPARKPGSGFIKLPYADSSSCALWRCFCADDDDNIFLCVVILVSLEGARVRVRTRVRLTIRVKACNAF